MSPCSMQKTFISLKRKDVGRFFFCLDMSCSSVPWGNSEYLYCLVFSYSSSYRAETVIHWTKARELAEELSSLWGSPLYPKALMFFSLLFFDFFFSYSTPAADCWLLFPPKFMFLRPNSHVDGDRTQGLLEVITILNMELSRLGWVVPLQRGLSTLLAFSSLYAHGKGIFFELGNGPSPHCQSTWILIWSFLGSRTMRNNCCS